MAEVGQNILDAIADLEAFVEQARQPSVFGQGKKVIDEQEFYSLIDDMRRLIPHEIEVANMRTAEAERALELVNIQADRIISEAQTRAVEIGSKQEVMRLAKEQAEDTKRVALSEANTIRAQADTYASQTRTKANNDASQIVNTAVQRANETMRKANSEATAMVSKARAQAAQTVRSAREEAAQTIGSARKEASDLMVSVDEVIANAQKALMSSRSESQSLMQTRIAALSQGDEEPVYVSYADEADTDGTLPASYA